jgi:DNA-damage-inducible protein D
VFLIAENNKQSVMAKEVSKRELNVFEKVKQTDENGNEFWSARELSKVLGYLEYRNFKPVIEKAKEACKNSDQLIENHFVDYHEMVRIGSGAERGFNDGIKLSRYACYLIVQNADPSKEVVALGQTYFAVQTRLQEIRQMDEYNRLSTEEEKRLFLRNEMAIHNSQLAAAAKDAGVIEPIDYAIFQNHGYMGLYGGLGAKEIHQKKGLKKSQQILDHMGSTELAANLFRATQTEDKLRKENIRGKQKANETHYEVGKKVRQTIKEIGGTMPEELPVADSIKELESKKVSPKLKK